MTQCNTVFHNPSDPDRRRPSTACGSRGSRGSRPAESTTRCNVRELEPRGAGHAGPGRLGRVRSIGAETAERRSERMGRLGKTWEDLGRWKCGGTRNFLDIS